MNIIVNEYEKSYPVTITNSWGQKYSLNISEIKQIDKIADEIKKAYQKWIENQKKERY